MNIEQVNSVLTKAIENFQEDELLMLWEFTVPSPHEMHRKTGMRLPKSQLTVPSPEQLAGSHGMVDAEYAKTHAAKSQDQIQKVFDKLKSGQPSTCQLS
jgi:hypothetical protein